MWGDQCWALSPAGGCFQGTFWVSPPPNYPAYIFLILLTKLFSSFCKSPLPGGVVMWAMSVGQSSTATRRRPPAPTPCTPTVPDLRCSCRKGADIVNWPNSNKHYNRVGNNDYVYGGFFPQYSFNCFRQEI